MASMANGRATEVLFHDVTFTHDGATRPLLSGITLHLPRGWTGVVGANGAGKSTLLRLATGELTPTTGHVVVPPTALYCPQRTDEPPEKLDVLLTESNGEAWQIKGRLGIEPGWQERWSSLSHGERKRAQIGVALWQSPTVLAIDEPTNHLDTEARGMLEEALRRYDGVGLLVSHDRNLLDDLCSRCVFVDPPGASMRPGGYSDGAEQTRLEVEAAKRERSLVTAALRRLEKEETRRRNESARANARRSKKNLRKGDSDARAKLDLVRVSGKDGQAGRLLKQMGGRVEQAREKRASIRVRKEYRTGIWMEGARTARDRLFGIEGGALPLGRERHLMHPDLVMRPDARIAITGPNGSGKSTLVRHLLGHLTVESDRVVYVPQEIAADQSKDALQAARELPKEALGKVMTVVSCLGSRPDRLLESEMPSPGEVRKLLLAAGIANAPHLIVMDEPTNHIDLPSIECLEEALSECPCGLVLVSHDRRFLGQLATSGWELAWSNEPGGDSSLHVHQSG